MKGIKLKNISEGGRRNLGETLDETLIVTGEAGEGTDIAVGGGGGPVEDGFHSRWVHGNTTSGEARAEIWHRRLDEDTFGARGQEVVSADELEDLP